MNLHRYLSTALGIAIGLCGISSQAEAILASVKTFGMAATGVAYPLDSLAGAFNPAGNAEICDRADFGISWLHNTGHAKITGNQLPGINGFYNGFKTKDSYAPDFGINKRLGCCDEWAVGLIVYNRNFTKTTYNKPFILLGDSHLGLEYLHQTISPIVAYKINECHNIGISANYMVQRLKINGLQGVDQTPTALNPIGSAHPGHVTNKGYDYSTGWSFTIGWQWHVIDNVTIGLTYQPETSMSEFKKYKGFEAGSINIPAMYSGGIAWRVLPCVVAAFDVQHYAWKNIRALHNPLLHDGVIEPLGSKHGPGFGFKSQTFYRFGVDWQINECWAVRAGFRHGNTPIRRSQTVVNQLTLDAVEDYLTVGGTFTPNCSYEISAFFAYGFKKKIKGKNSIPEGVPFLSPVIPFGFGGGESSLTEKKYALGLSLGWNY